MALPSLLALRSSHELVIEEIHPRDCVSAVAVKSCWGSLARMTEFLGALLCSSIQKDFHPVFQSQKLPDLHRPIFRAGTVFIDKAPHHFRTEQTALSNICF
jgi:hypothetical protein